MSWVETLPAAMPSGSTDNPVTSGAILEIGQNAMAASLNRRLDEPVVGALDDLAAKSDPDHVGLRSWQAAKIDAGIAAADRDDVANEEELEKVRATFASPP